jgi:hypothetical protein
VDYSNVSVLKPRKSQRNMFHDDTFFLRNGVFLASALIDAHNRFHDDTCIQIAYNCKWVGILIVREYK